MKKVERIIIDWDELFDLVDYNILEDAFMIADDVYNYYITFYLDEEKFYEDDSVLEMKEIIAQNEIRRALKEKFPILKKEKKIFIHIEY